MSKFKVIFFFIVLFASALLIIYEKQLKPAVYELNSDINVVDYYKIMWFGPKANHITGSKLKDKLDYSPDSVYLIDLRAQGIYEHGHIESSLSMPFDDFLKMDTSNYKNIHSQIVFICEKGKLAELACKLLTEKGITNTYYLEGGISNWQYKRVKREYHLETLK